MKFFREFFSLNGSEKRASLMLTAIILTVIAVRIAVPEKKIPLEFYDLSGIGGTSGYIPDSVCSNTGFIDRNLAMTDLNLSDSAELVKLPGVGPVLASRIVKYRNLLGGFVSINQLKEVYGIDTSIFQRLSGRITVDTTVVKKIYVNLQDFIRHPYLTRDEMNAILELRKQGVRFRSVSDLAARKIISRDKAEKLRYYFDFLH